METLHLLSLTTEITSQRLALRHSWSASPLLLQEEIALLLALQLDHPSTTWCCQGPLPGLSIRTLKASPPNHKLIIPNNNNRLSNNSNSTRVILSTDTSTCSPFSQIALWLHRPRSLGRQTRKLATYRTCLSRGAAVLTLTCTVAAHHRFRP